MRFEVTADGMGGRVVRWAGLDSVQWLDGAHPHAQAIDCCSYL